MSRIHALLVTIDAYRWLVEEPRERAHSFYELDEVLGSDLDAFCALTLNDAPVSGEEKEKPAGPMLDSST